MKAPQLSEAGAPQTPLPSQVAACVKSPALQDVPRRRDPCPSFGRPRHRHRFHRHRTGWSCRWRKCCGDRSPTLTGLQTPSLCVVKEPEHAMQLPESSAPYGQEEIRRERGTLPIRRDTRAARHGQALNKTSGQSLKPSHQDYERWRLGDATPARVGESLRICLTSRGVFDHVPGPFDAMPATIKDLLVQENQGFYIPIYQREYEWGEDQIDRFFEDVGQGISRASRQATDVTFLGTVILVEGRQTVQGNDRRAIPSQVLTIVDGQQRLTTLVYTMAAVLVELEALALRVTSELPEGSVKDWILSLLQRTRSRMSRTLYIQSDEDAVDPWSRRPRLLRQQIDSWGFSENTARYDSDVAWLVFQMISSHSIGNMWRLPDMNARSSLIKPFSVIRSNIRRVVEGRTDISYLDDVNLLRESPLCDSVFGERVPDDINDDIPECVRESLRIAMFCGFARDHVLVIDVRARDEDLAFALFEPLNATGLPLTPLETIKPLVVYAEGQSNYSTSPSAGSLGAVEGMLKSLPSSRERIRLTSELLTAFALAQTGEKLGYSLFEQRMWLHRTYVRPRGTESSLSTKRRFIAELRDTAEFLFGPWHRHEPQLCHIPSLQLSEEDLLNLLVLSDSRHVVVAPLLGLYWDKARNDGSSEDFRACLRAICAFWVL